MCNTKAPSMCSNKWSHWNKCNELGHKKKSLTLFREPINRRGVNSLIDNSRIRGNSFKLKEGRFRLDIGEILYHKSGEVLEQLPREAADAPSLGVFKARLDGPLDSLV